MGAFTFLSSHWRALALMGACLAAIGLYQLGKRDGRQDAALEAAKATAKAISQRANIDEKIIGMDSYRLCIELGGLQPDCEQLRGLETDKP
ncbi:hypothetical protein [Falsochrobactrum shanghaiense]|uniref:hypothetical protein n=1 Tax=Falsochrobactrum shanghaiense TaxID=2201899 RepID=UPI001304C8BB|nr:hypothetical protein [Falsochrobactrum shanghaiense]